jgi:hypothetical protein
VVRPAQRRVGKEGRGDQQAVGEIVEAVADQDQEGAAFDPGVMVVVAMGVVVALLVAPWCRSASPPPWEWRQSAYFSSRKKARMPPSSKGKLHAG